MIATTFCAGLRAIADAADLNRLDACRRSVDDRGQAGELSAAAVSILVDCCRERAVELLDQERVEPVAAPSPAPTTDIPTGFSEGEYAAVVSTAVSRHFDDSGDVLLVTLQADVGGGPAEVRARFDGNREAARAAAFRSCGLPAGSDPAQLVGRSCRVLLAPWTSTDGRSRLVVRRWVPAPKSAAPSAAPRAPSVIKGNTAKPPKSARPEWETDSDIPF